MLIELIEKNRCYRRFDEARPISKEDLLELLEAARLSPSAANLQTLRYYLSANQISNDAIFPHLKWAGYLRYWDGPEPGERPAAYILVLAPASASHYHHIDTGIALQSMLLRATEMGFGGCIIASIAKEEVHKALKLPDNYNIVVALALGYPAETVVIDEVVDPDDIEYWRDDDGVHHVPKRQLKDLIIY